ncbi:DUF58 domain-containing protein [Thermodesulfovibrio hydrogeniphilus]
MAISGLASYSNLKNIRITIEPPADIFANQEAVFKIRAKTKFLEAFLIRVSILNSNVVIPHFKGESLSKVKLIFPSRGKHKINEIFISSFFPFYFFKRTLRLPVDIEFVVFPKPIKCEIPFIAYESMAKTESSASRGKAFEGELSGVRDYAFGDPLKHIHWKATAKTSSIKTKDFSPPQGNPVIINIDDFNGSIEEKISKTTYTLIKLHKNGLPVGMKLDKQIFKPDTTQVHIRRMLYALALYGIDKD